MAASATFGFSLSGAVTRANRVDLSCAGIGGAGRVEMTGAATYEIDLAMMPTEGLKGLLVEVDTVDAGNNAVTAPVTLTWTSDDTQKSEEVSPGGFFALCSPSPSNGITALSIVSTADCVVHVTALG